MSSDEFKLEKTQLSTTKAQAQMRGHGYLGLQPPLQQDSYLFEYEFLGFRTQKLYSPSHPPNHIDPCYTF